MSIVTDGPNSGATHGVLFQPTGTGEEDAGSAYAEKQINPLYLRLHLTPINPLSLPAHLEGLGNHLADLLNKSDAAEKGQKEYARLTAQLDYADQQRVADYVEWRLGVLADPAAVRQAKAEEWADRYEDKDRGREIYEERQRAASGAVDSWAPVDLAAALEEARQEPTVGRFIENEVSNGGGVFYAGKVNSVFGPSESGKSMLTFAVAVQEIRAGHTAVMVDFEDDARSVAGRMRDLGAEAGVTKADILQRFIYIRPEVGFSDRAYAGLRKVIEDRQGTPESVSLAIIDAATEAMTLDGLNGRDENDVAKWQTLFPKRIAPLGPAVVVVDHSPLGDGDREIGSQHKKSGITGVSYKCYSIAQFAVGRKGRLRLYIAKDKIGSVRAAALPGKGGSHRGDLVIDGIGRPNNPSVGLWGVDPVDIQAANTPKEQTEAEKDGIRVPSEEEQRKVLAAIEETEGRTNNGLTTAVGGNKQNTRSVIEWMELNGLIRVETKGNSKTYFLPLEAPKGALPEDGQGVAEAPREAPPEDDGGALWTA